MLGKAATLAKVRIDYGLRMVFRMGHLLAVKRAEQFRKRHSHYSSTHLPPMFSYLGGCQFLPLGRF